MSGGSKPVRPSAFRSSAVKAIPLFNNGELSTASPRALVSQQPFPFRRRLVSGANSGITLCRMLLPRLLCLAWRAHLGRRARAMDSGRLLQAFWETQERETRAQGYQSEQREQRQRAGGGR